MSLYITLPRIDDEFINSDDFKQRVYNDAFEMWCSVDWQKTIYDDANPTFADEYHNMSEKEHKQFAYFYATDAADHIPDAVKENMQEQEMWHRRVNEFNSERYNDAINNAVWAIVDWICHYLCKYLGLEMDREVTHGEAA